MLKLYLLFIQLILVSLVSGQVSGYVYDFDNSNHKHPLIGANVYWLGTTTGTVTNISGYFELEKPENFNRLIISFIGYKNDTIVVNSNNEQIEIYLKPGSELEEIVISEKVKSNYISSINPIQTEMITEKGLEKLACCNLSESFENSANIDVNYSDAVSGAKHIKMLGLDGKYAQLLTENVPLIRGLSLMYGLNQVPGPWMESIQVSKGTSSVVNGYESVTGQINLELKKPYDADLLFINTYGNSDMRGETNVLSGFQFNEKLSTLLMLHGAKSANSMDDNSDGFIDVPLSDYGSFANRWDYEKENMESQLFINVFIENSNAGQVEYINTKNRDLYYGIDKNINGLQMFSKTGFRIINPVTSIGFIAGYNFVDINSRFGPNKYAGKQNYFYSNIIFRSYILNTNHQYAAGVSFFNDEYNEYLNSTNYQRSELVPGLFGEYTYTGLNGLTLITGARLDRNSKYGYLFTPRVHLKYQVTEDLTLRSSAGKGFRQANVIAENMAILASSRSLNVHSISIEKAWNYGINVNYDLHLDGKKISSLSVDFYRTEFMNQVITDLENPRVIHFYNLTGNSFSNSLQAQASVDIIRQLEILLAFRINDVKASYGDVLLEKPFVNKYKGLVSLSYATRFDKWQFDFTGQYNGKKRMPNTLTNPAVYQFDNYSPDYYIIHSQITRRFKLIEIYAGAENLLNITQSTLIIAADDPFGDFFDASMVWGPVTGRMWYAGLRFRIE